MFVKLASVSDVVMDPGGTAASLPLSENFVLTFVNFT